MNREEAVALLKEIQTNCMHLSPDHISLDDSNVRDSSIGYRVSIKGVTDQSDKQLIKNCAARLNLAVEDDENKLTIYRVR